MHPTASQTHLPPLTGEAEPDDLEVEVEERRLEIPTDLHKQRLDRAQVQLKNVSDQMGAVALQGPKVREFIDHASQLMTPGTTGDPVMGIAMLAQLARRQALTMAYNDMYLLLSATVAMTLLMVPLLAKPKAEVTSAAH